MIRIYQASSRLRTGLAIGIVCLGLALMSASMAPGSHALAASAASSIIGGSECADFMNGFAIGMGVGTLFGCLWCAGGAVLAKAVGAFC
jgi:hypothetical protein